MISDRDHHIRTLLKPPYKVFTDETFSSNVNEVYITAETHEKFKAIEAIYTTLKDIGGQCIVFFSVDKSF